MKKYHITGLVLSLFILFAYSPLAEALTLSPTQVDISADPGTTVSGQFLVTNDEATPETYYTSAQNFDAQGDSGSPHFLPGDTDLASWIKLDSSVTLAPGEQRTLPFTISIPSSATAGGHFAAIFLGTTAPQMNGATDEVSVGLKVGMLVLLHVTGTVAVSGGASGFNTSTGSHFYTTLPVDFMYSFTNTGGDRIEPQGTLTLTNALGMTSAEVPGNPTSGNVLPSSTRRFAITWGAASSTPQGFFGAVNEEWHNFAFGYYHANLVLAYGQGSTTNMSVGLFVLPWHLLLVIFVGLAILIPLLAWLVRAYDGWIIRRAKLQK